MFALEIFPARKQKYEGYGSHEVKVEYTNTGALRVTDSSIRQYTDTIYRNDPYTVAKATVLLRYCSLLFQDLPTVKKNTVKDMGNLRKRGNERHSNLRVDLQTKTTGAPTARAPLISV